MNEPITDADRLAMLEHRVTELERRLWDVPQYELTEPTGPGDWRVVG